ncbi:hypothetical protein ABTJ55_20205, partial [Acinetobacter baumannii]
MNDEPAAVPMLRKYLEASILTVLIGRTLCAEYDFDTVVMNHGIYVPHGPLAAVTRAQNRHLVAWSLA